MGNEYSEEEAIKWFEVFQDNLVMRADPTEKTANALKASRMAIKALEKQIPKHPKEEKIVFSESYEENIEYYCPSCGTYLTSAYEEEYAEYCDECGQNILWEEKE